MGKKVMTEVEKSIHEESEKISEARKAIKARKQIIDNSDIIPEELASDDWKAKEFSFPGNTVRIGTIFSGIGAIEHAFQRLKLNHRIVFAGDIDANCKKSYFANYEINEEDWFTDLCAYAEWTETPATLVVPEKDESNSKESAPVLQSTAESAPSRGLDLNYNIHIHLPATRDQSVYDALFASLAKHIPLK